MCIHELPPVYISREWCIGSLCTAVPPLAQVKRRCERLVLAHADRNCHSMRLMDMLKKSCSPPRLMWILGRNFRYSHAFLSQNCWISDPKPQDFRVISWISELWAEGIAESKEPALQSQRASLHHVQVLTNHTKSLTVRPPGLLPSPKEHEQVQVHARSCSHQGIHMHQLGIQSESATAI